MPDEAIDAALRAVREADGGDYRAMAAALARAFDALAEHLEWPALDPRRRAELEDRIAAARSRMLEKRLTQARKADIIERRVRTLAGERIEVNALHLASVIADADCEVTAGRLALVQEAVAAARATRGRPAKGTTRRRPLGTVLAELYRDMGLERTADPTRKYYRKT